MKESICFQCRFQCECGIGQVQPKEAIVSAITACYHFKPKPKPTNYDCMVHKTPEELAEWFAARVTNANDNCPDKHGYKFCLEEDGCPSCWLEWLRQETDNG